MTHLHDAALLTSRYSVASSLATAVLEVAIAQHVQETNYIINMHTTTSSIAQCSTYARRSPHNISMLRSML